MNSSKSRNLEKRFTAFVPSPLAAKMFINCRRSASQILTELLDAKYFMIIHNFAKCFSPRGRHSLLKSNDRVAQAAGTPNKSHSQGFVKNKSDSVNDLFEIKHLSNFEYFHHHSRLFLCGLFLTIRPTFTYLLLKAMWVRGENVAGEKQNTK